VALKFNRDAHFQKLTINKVSFADHNVSTTPVIQKTRFFIFEPLLNYRLQHSTPKLAFIAIAHIRTE